MGRYEREAREHVKNIAYYANHGAPGHALHQAQYHWDKLADLRSRAARSKNDKDDATVIQVLMESANQDMERARARDETRESSE